MMLWFGDMFNPYCYQFQASLSETILRRILIAVLNNYCKFQKENMGLQLFDKHDSTFRKHTDRMSTNHAYICC